VADWTEAQGPPGREPVRRMATKHKRLVADERPLRGALDFACRTA
jgi:hypothetical protein